MAVQKSKKSRSARGMRRSHDAIDTPALATEKVHRILHLRHNVASNGYYRGKKLINKKSHADDEG